MIFFYQIFIHFFSLGVFFVSAFNHKAKLFSKGRRSIFKKLSVALNNGQLTDSNELIWFHCSSLGEFEQARPLIERINNQEPRTKILITFFSPSGYEIRKNYEGADFIFYLPVDTASNAKRFLDIIKPSKVFFVKYDFWYNFLHELKKRKINTYLVSANFREDQFKGMYGRYLRKVLTFFNHIFVQNEASHNILSSQAIHSIISGDLRYDRVSQTVLSVKKNQIVEMFKGENKVLVCGSTWEKDEALLAGSGLMNSDLKLIIAPHEINAPNIQRIISLFPDALRYSQISKEPVSTALGKLQNVKVLIIDNIGMLSSLYQYASVAYVGGGFGSGIHNILEAVAFGAPVIFGPNHHKFPEANEIVDQGGGFSVSSQENFQNALRLLLSDEKILRMASMVCKNFVQNKRGATEKILTLVNH